MSADPNDRPPVWAKILDPLAADTPRPAALRRARRALDWARAGGLRWALPSTLLLGISAIALLGAPDPSRARNETIAFVALSLLFLVGSSVYRNTALVAAMACALFIVGADTQASNGWVNGSACSEMVAIATVLPLFAFFIYARRENLNFSPRFAAAVAAASGLGGVAMLHVYCGARAWQHLLFFHFGAVVLLCAAAAFCASPLWRK